MNSLNFKKIYDGQTIKKLIVDGILYDYPKGLVFENNTRTVLNIEKLHFVERINNTLLLETRAENIFGVLEDGTVIILDKIKNVLDIPIVYVESSLQQEILNHFNL